MNARDWIITGVEVLPNPGFGTYLLRGQLTNTVCGSVKLFCYNYDEEGLRGVTKQFIVAHLAQHIRNASND